MFKYILAFYIEKLHRYCFDIIYMQGRKITIQKKIILRIFDVCQLIISDYRRYLIRWCEESGDRYVRYTKYW